MKTLILSKKDAARSIDIKEAIGAVERVFREAGLGRTRMPAKIYLDLAKYRGDFRAMPAYVEKLGLCGMKWVNVHPGNRNSGLPTVMAVIILSSPKNGFPLCVMDGSYATNLRTGAAGAVAARYLARPDSSVVGLVGCGAQARTQALALATLFRIREVKIWGRGEACVRSFMRDMKGLGPRLKAAGTIEDCVRDSDIIVTTTPSRRPVVKARWIGKGVHINAIGADAKGKEELEPSILKRAKVVVDSWEQASHSGEINVPLEKGVISRRDIYAEIGEVVCGKVRGRANRDEVTVFDSTGLAIQDIAVADVIYKKALKKGIGRRIELV